jgi:hypothetical protein
MEVLQTYTDEFSFMAGEVHFFTLDEAEEPEIKRMKKTEEEKPKKNEEEEKPKKTEAVEEEKPKVTTEELKDQRVKMYKIGAFLYEDVGVALYYTGWATGKTVADWVPNGTGEVQNFDGDNIVSGYWEEGELVSGEYYIEKTEGKKKKRQLQHHCFDLNVRDIADMFLAHDCFDL